MGEQKSVYIVNLYLFLNGLSCINIRKKKERKKGDLCKIVPERIVRPFSKGPPIGQRL